MLNDYEKLDLDTSMLLATAFFQFKGEDSSVSSIFPEALLLLGRENVLDLLDLFGGKTIKLPTKRELLNNIKFMKYYILKKNYNYADEFLATKLDISSAKIIEFKQDFENFEKYIEDKYHILTRI